MSDESIERRRREREARRKEREEELKREEEELERQREERKRERERRAEERRLQEEKDAKEEEERRAARRGNNTPRAEEAKKDDSAAKEEEERAARRERERKQKEEEEKEASRREQERRQKEEDESRRERERKQREDEEKESARREQEKKDRERKRREEEEEEKESARREQDKKDQERKRREEEEEKEAARRKQREEEEQESARRDRARKEREEERKREADEEERKRKLDDDRRRQNDASRSDQSEIASLKSANKKLTEDVQGLTEEADSVRQLLVDAQKENSKLKDEIARLKSVERENENLKDEVARLKAAAAASPASSSSSVPKVTTPADSGEAPRLLTTATKGRPTKAGRRGQTLRSSAAPEEKDEEEEEEKEEKPVERPIARSTGNAALDMLAATMRGSASGSIPGLKKPAGGNVFVSAGTKGGEISRCLFMLKGKTRIRGVRVQDAASSITQNDVFILETKTHIWTYIGKTANRLKIARAVDVVGKMQRQRGQARSATLETVDNKEMHDDGADRKRKAFWGEFESGEPAKIPEGEDDTQWELDFEAKTSLFRVDPGFQLELLGQGKLKQEDLESDKVYLLDTPCEMFVWCGKASDMNLRKEAVEGAQDMVKKAIEEGLKPKWVEVERVAEKGEGALFEDKFFKWSDSMRAVIGKVAHKTLSNVAISDAAKRQELPRILEMHDGELEPEQEYTDEVDAVPEIFLVKDFRRAEVPKSEYGTFFAKQCYIILYRYSDTGIFYYWIGREAGVTETGTAASLAKEWAGEAGLNRPNLVRVDQGKEPRHFLRLFRGKLLVFSGERGAQHSRSKSLFHCRGTEEADTRVFECPDINGVYLNSDDAFILNTKDNQYLWLGEFANSHLRNVAKHICELVKGPDRTDYKLENEGTESSKFKEAIGGDLNGHAKHETRPNNLPVKFFLCSNANKQYRADRSAHFVQSDLSHSHQAILDRYSEVLVWIGRDTKPEDKKIALEVAIDYVEKANDGRKACPVLVLDEGEEVVDYTRYFQAWDPYKQRSAKKNITQRHPLTRAESSMSSASDLLNSHGGKDAKHSLKVLMDRDYLPPGVDKRSLENHLRDEDFPEAFGMTAKEFWALPAWKRLEKKKTSPLF